MENSINNSYIKINNNINDINNTSIDKKIGKKVNLSKSYYCIIFILMFGNNNKFIVN